MPSIGFGGLVEQAVSAVSYSARTGAGMVTAAAALAGPVTRPIRVSVAVVLGGSSDSAPAEPDLPVVWLAGTRLHVDLGRMLPFPGWVQWRGELERAVAAVPGVVSAHVEGILGRLVIERAETVDDDEIHRAIRGVVQHADAAGVEPGAGPFAAVLPAADPGDPLALIVPAVTAAMDLAAVAGAAVGRLGRFPRAPRAARAAVAVINHQPRMVALLEARLGRVGTDLLLTAVSAAAHGLGQAPGAPLLDLIKRAAQIAEANAHRQTWRTREPELADARRPQCPAVAVMSSAARDADGPRHSWAVAAAGEASHVVVDSSVDVSVDAAAAAVTGLVEDYVDQAANGSLIAAAGTLLGGGTVDDVADAVLAGVPKAAHMGREAFAAVLGRALARHGLLVLDPGALRRLDRVRAIVIDGAVLRGDTRTVLDVQSNLPEWSSDRVYEVVDALLHGEQAPPPDPDELPAETAGLRWHRRPDQATPALGVERADLLVGGRTVATVAIGWEPDPYSVPLLETARRCGATVVLRHVGGTDELGASVAAAHQPGTSLLDIVRDLRADRGPVLLISALHRDFVSIDTLAALAVADIGFALDDPAAATPWTADIIAGTDLAAAVRVLSAVTGARRATESAVRLAKAGTTLAGLLLVTGESRRRGRLGLGRWLSPVNAAGLGAWMYGALAAHQVARLPDPPPQPLTAWHALDPQIVYSRLWGDGQAEPSVAPPWHRMLSELSQTAVVGYLQQPAALLVRLAGATRRELSDPLTPILAVGAAAAAILGSNVDALLVAGVTSANAVVGGIQRLRAESAARALFAQQEQAVRRVVVPAVATSARRLETARSSSRVAVVATSRLRRGDVVDLRAAEVVPADARLLVADDLEVDESSLTGESVPVDKQVEAVDSGAANRASMLFEGSTIVAGRARAIVVATGAATAAHRAISAVADVAPSAGVQGRLRELTTKILPLTLAGGALVSGLSFVRRGPLRRAVADGVAIAVAAVPEGLPLVATMAQLAAARRLSKLGVLVRAPRTLEAVGRLDTVCFDKTGTLTLNRLAVVRAVPSDRAADQPDLDITDPRAAAVLRAAAWACPRPADEHGHAHATDEAILAAAADLPGDGREHIVVAEVAFESNRGYAASIVVPADAGSVSQPQLMLKGAPEVVLPRCRFDTGDAGRAAADDLVRHLAGQGLRVIAVARRTLDSVDDGAGEDPDRIDALAADLTLLGYVGLADTIRESARPLVEQLAAAGCDVALITGDHPITAAAIARQLGFPADARVVTGAELAAADEPGRRALADSARVFARVSPEQKVQVVAALQRCGRTVAMVGDGANDAAAIRMADAGIGLTGRGSSPAREAADIVLTGENLAVLLDTLREGRNMWTSVGDALALLLGGNTGEVIFTILGTALGSDGAPVNTRQLLLVNLLTDMFPALAIAISPPRSVADPAEAGSAFEASVLAGAAPWLERPLVQAIVRRGAATAWAATAAWAIGRWTPGTRRRSATMGLTALVGTQLAQTLVLRHESPLVMAVAAGSAAVLVGIVQTPGVSHFFGCTPLGPIAWGGVLAAVATSTAVVAFAPGWLTRRADELAERLPDGTAERDDEASSRPLSPATPVVPQTVSSRIWTGQDHYAYPK